MKSFLYSSFCFPAPQIQEQSRAIGHEGGNRLQLQDSIVRLVAGDSADQTVEQQLRVEWQEMRSEDLYPVVTELEADGESDPGAKPDGKSDDEHFVDDILVEHLKKLDEMLEIEEKLGAEKKTTEGLRARVAALEKDMEATKEAAKSEIERLEKEASTAKENAKRIGDELQVSIRGHIHLTLSANPSHPC